MLSLWSSQRREMDYLREVWQDVPETAEAIMKFGIEELTQAVRLNDISVDAMQQGLPEVAANMNVDVNALQHVASMRSLFSMELLRKEGLLGDSPQRNLQTQAAFASTWCDGFFAALHAVEQSRMKSDDR